MLPVRWMAVESLQDGIFTLATDVWSFGVVMWEVFSFAATPYSHLDNEAVFRLVVSGTRLEQPPGCPDCFYELQVASNQQEEEEERKKNKKKKHFFLFSLVTCPL